jgi:transcriptional regulator NrdR family protein
MKHVVKRAGHAEAFDNKKLYVSIFAACLAMREPVGTAEIIAEKVSTDVETWIEKKSEVLSNDIRRVAAKHLYSYNPDAAYAYMHHRIIW